MVLNMLSRIIYIPSNQEYQQSTIIAFSLLYQLIISSDELSHGLSLCLWFLKPSKIFNLWKRSALLYDRSVFKKTFTYVWATFEE